MLRRLLLSIFALAAMTAYSQTLRKYEYWVDSDYSKRTTVSNTKEDISFSISTQNQSEGVHFVNFRAQNTANEWGTISRYLYYVPEKVSANPTVVGYEYWLDGEYSKKKSMASSSSYVSTIVDISKLTEGVHFYNFRAKNSDGVWGNLYRYLFYVPEMLSANSTVVGYEYWLDGDYSKKTTVKSTSLDVTASVDISKLTEGVHFYNFRAKNSDGVWGNIYRYLFYVPEMKNANPKLNGYEYWLDDDYSKRVTSVSTLGDVNLMIDISKLTEGVHFLNFRAKNSECVHSDIKRYLFYVPGNDTQGASPIVGYRYRFNSKTTFVSVAERQELELNNLIVPLPTNKECANIEDGVFTFDQTTDNVEMKRTSKISFSMQFKNKAGNWSSPTVEEFTQSDQIAKTAKSLAVQKQVSFSKVSAGDYEVVKMVIPTSRTYYFRSSQSCDMQLYQNGTKVGRKISGASLKNTYNIGLDIGTYYAVIYNMVKDAENTTNDVILKLMLTDNITPTPEIMYSNETVTMTCAQEGAVIYYTLDGTDPSKTSSKYTAPFKLTHNAVIKAVAMYDDMAESNYASYTVDTYKAAAPTIEFANLKVYMSTTTPGAKIYYNLEGNDPVVEGTLYTAPVDVNKNCTVKAVAKLEGYNNSDITAKYIDVDNVTCIAPRFSLSGTQLSISSVTQGATIYYTTDNTEPKTNSNRYTGPIALKRNNVYKAIAVKSGQRNSSVTTYSVDWFQTETPAFAYDNGKLTISCATLDAVIYYEIGNKTPTTASVRYKQPVTLTDNSVVKAIAVADGFNASEVAVYTTNSFSCDAVEFAFDGRSITMRSNTAGAKIYYTTDGRTPTTSSAVYTAPVLLDGLCTVKAIAIKDKMNNSNVTTYELPCYYNGGTLSMAKAGTINEAFGWCDKNNVKSLIVTGNVNGDDIKQIAGMSALDDVDLSAVKVEGSTLADRAFANAHIRSIIMPSALNAVGSSLFSGCNRLAAIVWNANMVVPENTLSGISNPNLLLYVSVKSYAPSTVKNVVVNNQAESIVLKDASGNDFYAPIAFTAQKISYTHNYSMQTVKGRCQGWETLTLPFTASKVLHSTKGEIVPFANKSGSGKPFWLYEISSSGYRSATAVEAYKPYIISMPNNGSYADDYILGGDVTFSAENAVVTTTKVKKVEYSTTSGVHTYVPCFANKSATADIYPLNVNQSYSGYAEGSVFYTALRAVKPFEVYMTTSGADAKPAIPVFDDDVMGIDDVLVDGNTLKVWSEGHKLYFYSKYKQMVKIYTSVGQFVRSVDIVSGYNIVDDIADGIYIVNGHKIIIQ